MAEKLERWIADIYQNMSYYPAYREGDTELYRIQILTDGGTRLLGSFSGTTAQEVVDKLREAGITIHGDECIDDLRPRTALEKTMLDEILDLRRKVSELTKTGEFTNG